MRAVPHQHLHSRHWHREPSELPVPPRVHLRVLEEGPRGDQRPQRHAADLQFVCLRRDGGQGGQGARVARDDRHGLDQHGREAAAGAAGAVGGGAHRGGGALGSAGALGRRRPAHGGCAPGVSAAHTALSFN